MNSSTFARQMVTDEIPLRKLALDFLDKVVAVGSKKLLFLFLSRRNCLSL